MTETKSPTTIGPATPPPEAGATETRHVEKRVSALDGIRGLALLFVFLFHAVVFWEGAAESAVLIHFARAGWIGVDLFFALSGFLITGILCDSKMAKHYFRNFYARRVVRIFPLYYLMLFLVFGVYMRFFIEADDLALYDLSTKQGWFWLYGINIWMTINKQMPWSDILNHYWSLSVEEHFYLLWPFAVYFLSRRSLMRLCGFILLASFCLRVYWVALDWSWVPIYVCTLTRLDGVAAGSFVALVARGPGGLASLVRWAKPVTLACAAVLAGVIVYARGLDVQTSRLVQTVGMVAFAPLFASVLVGALTADRSHWFARPALAFAEHPIMTFLGRHSYAMYIFHWQIMIVMRDVGITPAIFPRIGGTEDFGQLMFYALLLVFSSAVGYVVWHVYEKHFLALKRFFPYE